MSRWLVALLGVVAAAVAAATDGQVVFSERSEVGQLWANLSVSFQRLDEPYLPMVIGVQNLAGETLRLGRDSFILIGPDGRRFPMADLRELRRSYDKASMDRRIATANGIPVDVWARQRRLRESNFFPDVSQSRRTTVINRVTLSRGDGTFDLIYFEMPAGLAPGAPFLLEVLPEGWTVPLRLRLVLS
jgi:hypothetical protein